MKKLSSLLLVPSLFFASSAANAEFIAGINAGVGLSGSQEYEIGGYTSKYDSDTTRLNIFIGNKNSRNNRLLLSYDSIEFKPGQGFITEKANGFRLDSEFVYLDSQVKPYWGLGFGVYNNKDMLTGASQNYDSDDVLGVSVQIKAGAKIELSKQVEFDISAETQAIAWQEVEVLFGENMSPTYSHFTLNAGVAFLF